VVYAPDVEAANLRAPQTEMESEGDDAVELATEPALGCTASGHPSRGVATDQLPHQAASAMPLPDPAIWLDLERHILDIGAQPHHYLLCGQKTIPRVGVRHFPARPMSDNGAHLWWYRCLRTAGVVPTGTNRGERMHKARHTAGQRVLDSTGNLKAVQKLLGHSSIQTTGDIYADWDIDQLTTTLACVLKDDAPESYPP
jgi:hypothetical protein